MPSIFAATDEPAKALREPCSDNRVVMGLSAAFCLCCCHSACTVQNSRARPWHCLHYHAAQRAPRNIHTIPQSICSKQAGAGIIAENIGQRACVDGVNMLRIKRQAIAREPVGNPAVDRAHALDRGKQPQNAAICLLNDIGICACKRGYIAALDIGDDQNFRASGIVKWALRFDGLRV